MGFTIEGSTTGNGVEANAQSHLKVVTETDVIARASNVGGARMFSENDQGYLTGIADLASPEVDIDYRMRVSQDALLDDEVFTAENDPDLRRDTGDERPRT